MVTPAYRRWLVLGRRYQHEGRAVDAMLCFERAHRARPRASDAPFHLGEMFWALGRFPDAIAAWRAAASANPRHLAPNLALAEALLAGGDAAGARDAAATALGIAPGNTRAEIIGAVARIALGEPDGSLQDAAAMLELEPQILEDPAIAGALALALDRYPHAMAAATFLASLGGSDAALMRAPPLLLALVSENAARTQRESAISKALIAAAEDRDYAPADHYALRRIASAIAEIDAQAGVRLVARYAATCAAAHMPAAPNGWPRRTAGMPARVIVLLAPVSISDSAQAVISALASLPRSAFAFAVATAGAASAEVRGAGSMLAPAVAELPGRDDPSVAKALATRDFDVLVDLAGLAAAPLLAQRPARNLWALADAAQSNVAPIVDRVFDSVADLVAALRALHAAHDASGDCPLDAATLDGVWNDAVRIHQRGDRTAARDAYSRVLDLQPGFASAHYLRGIVARDEGEIKAARADFAAALAAAPLYIDARIAAARAAGEDHEPEMAMALCEEGIARAPGSVELWRSLGLAHLALRNGAEASASFGHALALDPVHADTHYNHGVALQTQRLYVDAARAYQRALAFKPSLINADYNLGVLFQEQGAYDAAIKAYETVLKTDPAHVSAYKNLGEVLLAAGKFDAWIANFGRFEANCPDALPLAVQALEVCQYLGDFPKLEHYLEGLRQESFRVESELQLADCLEVLLYLLLYFDVEPEMAIKFAQTYDAIAKRIYGEPLALAAQRKPGRLRIGYLSADLRNHVMGKMMWAAIAHHDKARFELHFYSLSIESDEWTERFRGIADHFEVVATMTERAAAKRIAADDLDILIDLSAHTKGARPGILAFKPARVQITHVASAGTVGLAVIDFKLTDALCDLPESAAFQIEAPLVVEGCVYPYRHVAPASQHPFHRAALGIAEDAVVIGAFVSALKLSRRCLTLWRDVLERIPRAMIALSPVNPGARALYLRLAAAGGIASDRLLFLPQGRSDAENQARYSLVDFVLDPMPYGGVNGTLEALDMGVPVVTLVGRGHAERTSYSILANLGVTDTVAQGGREYVELAVRLADEPAFMGKVRAAIRDGLAGSKLTDMAGHARNLEAAYIAALRERAPDVLEAARLGDG